MEPSSSAPPRAAAPAAMPESAHAGVVRSASVVSLAVLASRIAGLAREFAFARFFGAGGSYVYDAYVAAFRIPNLFRDLLAEGALSAAFVTTFSKTMSNEGEDAAYRLANRVVTVLVPFVSVVCVLGALFAPQLIDLIFPGYGAVPGKRELTIELTRILSPFLIFMALSAQAVGVLNAKDRFAVPALASACFNVVSLATGLALGFWIGPHVGLRPIVGMAVGTLIGGAAQYVWQWPSLRSIGFRFRPDLALGDPALRQIVKLMGPAVIGAAAVQVNVVVNSNFASQITNSAGEIINGPVGWLGYAFRFMQLPLGLFGVAIASATLPAISRSAASNDRDAFRETLSRSLGLVFLLTLPSAVGLIILSRSVVGAIYQHGEFTATDTEQTALALAYYCLGLVSYAAVKVLTPAFYALDNVRVPAAASLASIVLNYFFNWLLVRRLGWGHEGLALSTSLVAGLNFLTLFLFIRAMAGGIHGRRLLAAVGRVALAAAAMGGVVAASSGWIGRSLGEQFWGRLTDLAVSAPLGVVVFYGVCRLVGVRELALAERAVLARFRR